VGLLNTCANVVALELGRYVHYQIIQCGLHLGALVGSSLVMEIWEDAGRFFNKMTSQDVVTWNIMIGTCPMHVQILKILQHATSSTQIGKLVFSYL